MKPAFSRWRIALVAIAFLGAMIANLWLVPTSFSIEAITEIVRLELTGASDLGWKLENVSILADPGKPSRAGRDGVFRPARGATLLIERTAKGPLEIRCEARAPTRSCGEFKTGVQSLTLGGDVSFEAKGAADDDKTRISPIVLPFEAHAELGNHLELSDEVPDPAMLMKAHIRVLGRAFIGGGLFDGGAIDAGAGDYLRVDREREAGVGFIRISADPGMMVAYRAVGRSLSVTRLRSRGYTANTSLYARVTQDTSLQLLWGSTLVFIAFLKRASEPASAGDGRGTEAAPQLSEVSRPVGPEFSKESG